ncbi:longevity assurance factor, putative [Perkinsus marinus ATCC 50983]|uniref:Longevity assurance factor, putative n=1 Tax=Perkinsus marinus (strain ATCC 50983 / TXsc) TaxID=423536 RepID=C5M180_PERM5|nr:longevity assurance factor, putative [Perkinsus marinus ATCC 50983]EEQ97310.1 longevity assurance factor, putative [Perkinsus marinus ATCC 50983]|eukprot:XP_002764593.1 longevity assurance factor, putative [Perkinsus marinus ATCC 50983]
MGSFYVGHHRIGLIVIFLHNISDVPLYVAKSLSYLAEKYERLKKITDLAFVNFVLGFFFLRLYVYPRICVIPACTFAIVYKRPLNDCVLALFLVLLQCLHILWASMIIKMIFKTIKNHTVVAEGDIRSDDEEVTLKEKKPVAHKRKVQ